MSPIKLFSESLTLLVKNNLLKNVIKVHHTRNIQLSASVLQEKAQKPTSADSSQSNVANERDPAPYFFNPKVQELLIRLTGLNLDKVYRIEPRPILYENPRYEFMTEKQLQLALEEAKKRAAERLQFPPILKEREPIDEVLSYDPELQGNLRGKLVCVDISFGISDKKRTVVVRDEDGTLRRAGWEERDRMNQIYFPVIKRKLGIPQMFLSENLEKVLNREEYEFVLDRACLQFEPDSAEFIKVLHRTFDHIESRQKYDVIQSTRHYGPMVFYYAFYTIIDNLLIYLIKNDRIDEAANLVILYHELNPDTSKSASTVTDESTSLSIVKQYLKLDAVKVPQLELIIQSYEELQKSQQQYKDDVKRAHGQT